MHVEMRHQLPALLAAIYHQTVTIPGYAFIYRQLLGNANHMPYQAGFFIVYISQRGKVFSGNDKQVHR
jgi:hypothetical protein